MGSSSEQRGHEAEEKAARYLTMKGYEILKTRYRCRFGDIDLVLRKDGQIIFLEVKFRSSLSCGRPVESVTASKREKIVRTARCFLYENGTEDVPCRFDVLELWTEQGRWKARHYKNVFD